MVNYKVRTFCEPEDADSVGAEVRIYSDEGDVIDTILITTESQYQELASRIDNMDANYLDLSELKEIMANAQDNEIYVNAATFDGMPSSQFAKAEHNELHKDYYAPIDHALETGRYGLGTSSKFGHVKVINNLDSALFNNGEALSAYQGKELKDLINAVKAEITKWTRIECGSYGVLRVNTAMRLCRFTYLLEGFKSKETGKVKLHSTPLIPEEYCPPVSEAKILNYNNTVTEFSVSYTGHVYATFEKANVKTDVNAEFLWRY